MNTNELLEQLRQPFPPDAISWLPGSTTKDGGKCMAMAYADLRAYQERLDELMGLDWSVRYIFWGDNRIACELTLYVGGALGRREEITRSSTGEMAAQDEKNGMGGTVAEAQAFKRAAAMFGLGRYLYELPAAWVGFDSAAKKISKEGQTELDNRYRTWYTKKMAAASKRTKPVTEPLRVVDTSTGEIVSPEPATDSLGDVLFRKDATGEPKESPPHQHMWGLGMSVFGPDWDMARPWLLSRWTGNFSSHTRNSASDLSDDEKTMLAEYIKANAKKLQDVWPAQKKVFEQRNAAAQAQEQEPIATVA